MTDIAVVVLIGQEKIHLQRCIEKLAALKPRQIFLVESQPDDGGVAIAKETAVRLGLRLETRYNKWPGLYAKQFNWALDNLPIEAKWVLRLDADEYLTEATAERLRGAQGLCALPDDVTGLNIELKRRFCGGEIRHGTVGIRQARIFRYGIGRCEERAMDEHIVLSSGRMIDFDGAFYDDNLNGMDWWREKHRGYAKREAADALAFARGEIRFKPAKEAYYKMPRYLRATIYFCIRYFLRGGFLDGYAGWMWNFWQGLWYRWIVDREIGQNKTEIRDSQVADSQWRNVFFDILRGVGIIFVYWGHTARWGTLHSRMIYGFHMPLFFFISGVFFVPERIESVAGLLHKIWRILIVPYLFFCFVGTVLCYDIMMPAWTSQPFEMVIGIVHGEYGYSIWFLVCLATVQFATWLVARKFSFRWWMIILLVIVAQACAHVPERIRVVAPLMLVSVPSAMLFFVMGLYRRSWWQKLSTIVIDPKRLIALLVASIMGFAFVASLQKATFGLADAKFSIKCIPLCAFGFLSAYFIAKTIELIPCVKGIFAWIGKNSLCLFSVELLVAHLLSRMTNGFFESNTSAYPLRLVIELLRIVAVLISASLLTIALKPMLKWCQNTMANGTNGK